MKFFAEIVDNWKPLTTFAKSSILDVCQSSEYASPIKHCASIYHILAK